MQRATFGPLPAWPQTVPHAEHHALAEAISQASGSVIFYSDCQGVCDAWAMGPRAASSAHPYAHIWRRILYHKTRLEQAGFTVEAVKVAAHLDPESLEAGSDLQFRAIGNDFADRFAK